MKKTKPVRRQALEQHHPRRRAARRPTTVRDDHRVRLVQPGLDGLAQPAAEQRDRVGGEVALGQARPASTPPAAPRGPSPAVRPGRHAADPSAARPARARTQVRRRRAAGAECRCGTPPQPTRRRSHARMTEVHHGLEGVVAFETEIAEPDKEGSALRYRGVDIEEIVGRVPFEKVWGLLIDGSLRARPAARRGLQHPRPHRRHPRRRPGRDRDARAGVRHAADLRHLRRAGPRGPQPGRGDGAVVRRPGRPRARQARRARSARSTRARRSPTGS